MPGEDIVKMSVKELRRLKIIQKALDKEISQIRAAELLELSVRQVRRLVRRIGKEGEASLAHKARGRPSNRCLVGELRDKVIGLYREKYSGFGPTLTNEKLAELDGVKIGTQTLRNWLIEDGLWEKRGKSKKHRQWRKRKECLGEMVQMDGSHHDWLEGRGPELVLMGYIDDATSQVFARFYDYEGTLPAMDSLKRYTERYGIPQSVYADRHSTQDRLIKEMRLKGIKSKAEANHFLGYCLPQYNKRFQVIPAQPTDLRRPLPAGVDMDDILCLKTKRTVRNDLTIVYNKRLYQLSEPVTAKRVMIHELISGSMLIKHDQVNLKFKEILSRPVKAEILNSEPLIPKKLHIPPKDHPWRRYASISQIGHFYLCLTGAIFRLDL